MVKVAQDCHVPNQIRFGEHLAQVFVSIKGLLDFLGVYLLEFVHDRLDDGFSDRLVVLFFDQSLNILAENFLRLWIELFVFVNLYCHLLTNQLIGTYLILLLCLVVVGLHLRF